MSREKYVHTIPGRVVYDGMSLSQNIPLDNVFRVRDMQLLPSDVVVASYPKTGTTLLQEVVWLVRNGGDTLSASQTVNVARVPFMEYGLFDNFKVFENLPHPRHMKTHLPYRYLPQTVREGKAKAVYIYRNPKDALVSYYHFHRMNKNLGNFTGTWDDFFNFFTECGYILGYGNLIDHMREYWEHRNDKNMCIVSFEELIKERHKAINTIAEFLECDLSEETVDKIAAATGFEVMKSSPMTNMRFKDDPVFDESISPFFRSGKIGNWKEYFNEEQNKIIDEMEREKLAGTGLTFVYK